jgi:hypothetical protein
VAGVAVQVAIGTLPVSAMFAGAQALFRSIPIRDDAAHVEVREKNHMLQVLQLQSINVVAVQAGLSPVSHVDRLVCPCSIEIFARLQNRLSDVWTGYQDRIDRENRGNPTHTNAAFTTELDNYCKLLTLSVIADQLRRN